MEYGYLFWKQQNGRRTKSDLASSKIQARREGETWACTETIKHALPCLTLQGSWILVVLT